MINTTKFCNFFVFEGIDGVGKTSLSKAVKDKLSKKSNWHYLSFPGKSQDTLGGLVYKIHHDYNKFFNDLDAISLQTLHLAAHIDMINNTIVPLLNSGANIILDRFWWSTYVYGVVSGCSREITNSLIETEKLVWGGWVPSAIFYIENAFTPRQEMSYDQLMLSDVYEELINKEKSKSTIVRIKNKNFEYCMNQIIDHIENV